MEIIWLGLGISIALLFWLSLKIIVIMERQLNNKQNLLSLQQQFEQLITKVQADIAGGNSQNNALQQQFLEKLHKIDAAQTNLKEISSSILGLKDIFTDKRSRGAFGEAQLSNLIENLIPLKFVKYQHNLSNGKRADCLIILPAPSNPLVIDAKFPLENYQQMMNHPAKAQEHQNFKRLFKTDIKHHIDAIADKYIIPPETADSAIMFIPAEAIFAEIHAYNPDLVAYAHKKRVWLASPNTLMAILTTAASVIKDDLTQKNLDEIRLQLQSLGSDFIRFEQRLQNLFKHIAMCNDDASKVQISAQKLIQKFNKIEDIETSDLS